MTNKLALLAHWSVRQRPNRVSSVQFSYVVLYTPSSFILILSLSFKFKLCVAVTGRINVSGRLAVDDCGRLLVLDVDGRRVVQFDAELRQLRELVARDARLRYPARLCVDARRGRLYVADNELSQRTRLQTRFWGKTGRLIVYDIGASL